jgi:Na+/proline symporter
MILLSRICLVIISCLSAFLAQNEYSFIFWLVVFVWSALTASFVPLCLSIIYGKTIFGYQAIASIIVGFLTTAIWKMFFFENTGIGEIIIGTLLAFLAIPTAGWIGQKTVKRQTIYETIAQK